MVIGSGGAAIFDAAFGETVTFSGSTGKLVLAQSRSYSGTIYGFSTSGGTSLDLRGVGFVSADEASWSSGVLTVTDGRHTARINLAGDFSGSTFTAASDGHGGVIVTDPSLLSQAVTVGLHTISSLEIENFQALPEPRHIQLAGAVT